MNILFVCTGNTCRSPMAEVIARSLANKLNRSMAISSRGLSVLDGETATAEAQAVAAAHGLDLSAHKARSLTVGDANDADVIYTMTTQQKSLLTALHPAATDKVETLCEVDVADPWGYGLEEYERVYAMLAAAIATLPALIP